ncbi:ClpXP protease specificity-enhancing factor [Pararobbsia silviterrae]|uniref:ClpXP protease specificity-enhancing factor n=1 Tax=Pararobbsia silviterrae TaxID=1792498 RepID=A0A494XC81_9BURK|nr:ClpXP protease specificity-enhancing factor [Pararobbsia silviterrae]RKP45754.1 ClpXP protease specificity-enhancing factor [Pararobbsia silviterrae]
MAETPTKPYLLRALYEWCTDNGYTPHLAVRVDDRTRVPREFVRDGEIVLNISFEATSGLKMGNEWIDFNARFSGKSHHIEVQVSNVLAIYARENGQGMAFPVEERQPDDVVPEDDALGDGAGDGVEELEQLDSESPVGAQPASQAGAPSLVVSGEAAQEGGVSAESSSDGSPDDSPGKGGRGHLKVVK